MRSLAVLNVLFKHACALLRSRRFPEQALKSRSVKDEIGVNLIALL